jgi:hypothetical protein
MFNFFKLTIHPSKTPMEGLGISTFPIPLVLSVFITLITFAEDLTPQSSSLWSFLQYSPPLPQHPIIKHHQLIFHNVTCTICRFVSFSFSRLEWQLELWDHHFESHSKHEGNSAFPALCFPLQVRGLTKGRFFVQGFSPSAIK